MNSIIFLILGVTIAPVFSGLPSFEGRCPTAEVATIKNFNQTEFQGFWYIIERYEENKMNCSRFNYIWSEGTREFNQILMQKGAISGGSETEYTSSVLYEKEKFSNNGEYIGKGSIIPFIDYYQFVDTDYENYGVVWVCLQILGTHEQNLLVMAKDKFFDINSSESLNATLAKAPFNRNLLKKIDHTHKLCENTMV